MTMGGEGMTFVSQSSRPTVIDLYAGAGGLSLGMEQAGFDVAVAAEFDPVHALTHRFNFPHTPVLSEDLSADSPRVIAERLLNLGLIGEQGLDAIVGGPPCQGFSTGGVRDESDERNGQLHRFVDLVLELRPKVFCLENVAGLLERRFDHLRTNAVHRLEDAGYTISGHQSPVDAKSFGVPQSRRRVLIMGAREGYPTPKITISDVSSTTVADAFDGLPSIAAYGRLLAADSVVLNDDDYQALLNAKSPYARILSGIDAAGDDFSPRRVHDQRTLTNSLRTVHRPKSVQRFSRTQQGKVEKVSRLFRLSEVGVSRTLRAGTGTDRGSHTSPRPIHPVKNRVITVREAARLHGYPDWFRFHGTNWHGHRQVGNSVPPPLARAAGRALMDSLGVRPSMPSDDPINLGDPLWLLQSLTEASRTLNEQIASLAAPS